MVGIVAAAARYHVCGTAQAAGCCRQHPRKRDRRVTRQYSDRSLRALLRLLVEVRRKRPDAAEDLMEET
jgi:hypothetical protein